MQRNRMITVIAGILVLVLGLVMITRWTGKETVDITPTSSAEIMVSAPQATDTEAVVEQSDEGQETPPTQTVYIKPTPRTALDATDPATVMLGSGEIQLVEFFAYW